MTTPGSSRGASPADPARPSHDALFEDPLDLDVAPAPVSSGSDSADDDDPLDVFFAPRSSRRPPAGPVAGTPAGPVAEPPVADVTARPSAAPAAAAPAAPPAAPAVPPAMPTAPPATPAVPPAAGPRTDDDPHAGIDVLSSGPASAAGPFSHDPDESQAATDEPARRDPRTDTGRLFKSAGASGPAATAAIPALGDEQIRSRAASADASSAAGAIDHAAPAAGAPMAGVAAGGLAVGVAVGAAGVIGAGPAEGAPAAAGGAVPMGAVPGPGVPPVIPGGPGAEGSPGYPTGTTTARSGLTGTGVWVLVTGVTVLAALADGLLNRSAGLGWITGVALVVSAGVAALMVRSDDLWLAVIVPPLAFMIATLTAGQLTLPGGQGLLIREGLMVFTNLSLNAPWLLGATGLALVIVLVRRARFRKAARA